MSRLYITIFLCFSFLWGKAQLTTHSKTFTLQDTLRGSINNYRNWWNVLHYAVQVQPHISTKSITANVKIDFEISDSLATGNMAQKVMQIDLAHQLIIDSAILLNTPKQYINFSTDNNARFATIMLPNYTKGKTYSLQIYYHGVPQEAKKAPWDGGFIWKKDSLNQPFISVACQGLGASCWYPCKDHQSDEPDNGATISIVAPNGLVGVGNGKLINHQTSTNTYTWQVTNPINSYTLVPYIGNYVAVQDTFNGIKGVLPITYYMLAQNQQKAMQQFAQVKLMLKAFEHWFGAYPFYQDGYKIVEAPFLGMEHQSAIAYGNGFKNGYLGKDLSKSGWGLLWDFIIVHESGHEWFANNITTQDIADMWVHESFTCYSETLFTEYYYGKQAADEYNYGIRNKIQNDEPIISPYGVNHSGSGDMYFKGANMLHSLRKAFNNDEKFRQMLISINQTFYHQTVTTQQIENFISNYTQTNWQPVFNQYLRTTQVPVLQANLHKKTLSYYYNSCVSNFNLPIHLPSINLTLKPTTAVQTIKLSRKQKQQFTASLIEKNYYIKVNLSKN